MAYKRTQAVNKIYCQMDRFLTACQPNSLYLTTPQYKALLDDKNKLNAEEKKKPISELPPYKGYPIKEYNP